MLYIKRLLLALAALTLVAACSSGGGGPGKAEITADNAKDLAVAGAEATRAAADSEEIAFFKSGSSTGFDVKAFSKRIAQSLYATDDLSEFCSNFLTGGSYVITYPDTATSSNYTATATFTNCEISDGLTTATLNGTMTIRGTSSSVSISANITVTEDGITETFTFSGTCSVSNGNVGSCSYSSSFTGSDGRTYSMSNISVSGSEFSGYTVSGSVTDPDHGVITITTNSPVYFNCPNGNPSPGEITITGSNGSATVFFDGCDRFIVTFNGVGNSYNWADI